jgi:hypothetical protein
MNKLKPIKLCEDIRQSFLRKTHLTCEELADAVEQISEDDIKVKLLLLVRAMKSGLVLDIEMSMKSAERARRQCFLFQRHRLNSDRIDLSLSKIYRV